LNLRNEGKAVLLISGDFDELFALSDRISVMYEGKFTGVFKNGAHSLEEIGLMMSGHSEEDAVREMSEHTEEEIVKKMRDEELNVNLKGKSGIQDPEVTND